MKKFLAVLLAMLLVVCTFAACGGNNGNDTTTAAEGSETTAADEGGEKADEFDYDAVADTMTSEDGTYEIAFVTDVGQLKDKSFNQGTWEGIKRYASENGKSYKYYQPANGAEATDDDRFDAMTAASDAGAKIIVCAGFLQGTALTKAAIAYPEVKFVFIDGWPLTDENGEALKNVCAIDFQEEQSGYLAGYAAVKEGYTKLGFAGGGGGENPACCRFGYGFVQGADAAAKELDTKVAVNYSWLYGASFSAGDDLQAMLNGWYANGTEVVFSCGGSMCQSAFAAAAANDGKVIGVDVDQSSESDTVITSATKGLHESVMFALDKFYSDAWAEVGGVQTTLGATNDAVGLPTDSWSFEKFTVEDYTKLLASLKDGTVTVDKEYANLSADSLANVELTVVE